jgi:4-amino-4-deoxy-L-arabinose transferase-like glycosyltransferase
MRPIKVNLSAAGIFCLALLVRVVYNLTAASGYVPVYDAAIYNNLAQSLLVQHCYCYAGLHPTVFRPPLWPFIIAAMYFFTGVHVDYIRFLCSLLGSGTCVFIYFLARDLFGKRIALVTGLVAAVYVGLFLWDGWLYTESLYTFCLTGFTYALYRLQHSSIPAKPGQGKSRLFSFLPGWRWLLLSGIFFGLISLTRPNGSSIAGLLCIWAVLVICARLMSWQSAFGSVLVIVLIALAINLPWLYRDYTVTHSIVPVSTLGQTLDGAYNNSILQPDAHGQAGMWYGPPNMVNADFHTYTMANEQDDLRQALTWMRTHLSDMPYVLALHLRNMWTPYIYSHGLPIEEFPGRLSSAIILTLIPSMSIPVFLLAAAGLLLTWKRKRKDLVMVYLIILLTIAENVIFYGLPRFRAPIEPLLVLFAGGALWWLLEERPGRRMRRLRYRTRQEDSELAPVEVESRVKQSYLKK